MVELIWTEPALSDLDTIADYIALDKPEAARRLVRRVFQHVEQLADFPESGSWPQELDTKRYRQIVEPPCRVLYRYDGERVFILHVMRSEMRLRRSRLARRERGAQGSLRNDLP
jgi:toxin ParE1/3/4